MIRVLLVLEGGPKTLSSLARELGTNKKRLKDYLRDLEDMGYVEKVGRAYELRKMPEFLSKSPRA